MRSRLSVSFGVLGKVGMVASIWCGDETNRYSSFAIRFSQRYVDLRCDFANGEQRTTGTRYPEAAFVTVLFSILFSNNWPWKIRFTYTLGVCTRSASSSPGSTRCSTSAMVILAAVAIMGLKLRAVFR